MLKRCSIDLDHVSSIGIGTDSCRVLSQWNVQEKIYTRMEIGQEYKPIVRKMIVGPYFRRRITIFVPGEMKLHVCRLS